MSKAKKPELYFKHKDILNQIQLDKSSFGLYLHENMLDFFTDIDEIANCLDAYSLSDACESQVSYSYDQQQYINEFQEQNAILNAMAITECNLHVGAPHKTMFAMVKPQYYDYIRKNKENKVALKDYSKDNQILSGVFMSEDLLIRSYKEIQ